MLSQIILVLTFIGLLFILGASLILSIVDRVFSKKYGCLYLGQHEVPSDASQVFDGVTMHATCTKCGKYIMKNNKGDWI